MDQAMIAYLDTNAFDHLYKKVGCTAADIANLRKKIYGRELSIRPSLHILSEILLDRRARPELMVARIKLTLSLVNFRRMVKACDQLLTDDIRGYAALGEASRPYISADLQNTISSGIAELVESDGEELDEEMIAALEVAAGQTQQFYDRLASQIMKAKSFGPSFDDYFQVQVPGLLETCAANAGVIDECRARGLDGLRTIPSVRAAIDVTLSCAYGQSFEGWSVNEGDPFNLRHVPCAVSAAETFVTNDKHLHRALSRVQLDGFEVTDLPGFLARLR
jgi:hypothetical protein